MQVLTDEVHAIRRALSINSRELADLLGTSPTTVSRWQTGTSRPSSSMLKTLLAVEHLASRIGAYLEPDAARLWLYRPHPQLGGLTTPADAMAEGRLDDVDTLLSRLETGAYV